ncbi:MAG: bifunctional oligoribonuclease/PAP phosphatase NrnA [Prevotellaceae bacterium]|nr:bifunctional oligoribonuclease/PAP phosphatase NrnA [Prevotellaceae bacterium]
MLRRAGKVSLVVHVNPDGDAMGASIALYHCLRVLMPELEVAVVSPNRFPDFLKWMDGAENVFVFRERRKAVKEVIATSDVLICLDFNALSRLEDLGEFIESTSIPRVLIDHHIDPKKEEFLLMISDVKVSSTSELIFRLAKDILPCPLPRPAADAIMAGMMTDTNMFRDNSSNPDTFKVVAELLEMGVDKEKVSSQVFDNFSVNRVKLLGFALSEKMVVLPEYHAAYISVSQSELGNFSFQPGDTEGFVNYPLNIKGVNLSAYISEQLDGSIRFSFRSRGAFSVNDFARRHFAGGGHKNAAGGRMETSLDNAIAEYIKQLEYYKDEISASI